MIQDVEVPVDRLAEFLAWFDEEVGMRPVWLCPVRGHAAAWPIYPLDPGRTYVNVGFWGTVHVGPEAADAPRNRAIEAEVHVAGRPQVAVLRGVLRPRRPSTGSTTAPHLARVKARYDPDDRLTSLYDKAVRRR